jgi:ABC transporter DrrB family efflux protein
VTRPTQVGYLAADTAALFGRNMLRYRRRPDVFVLLLMQPLVLLLLFRYIVGGEMRLSHYVEYLLPGILALTVVMGSASAGIGLAEDIASGGVERLRALPIARSAFLAARAFTDVARNLIVLPLIGVLGVILGFQVVGALPRIIAAVLLLLLLGSAFAWMSMAIALWTGSLEATQGAAFLIAIVFAFASSGFAEVSTMPRLLQHIVNVNPVTHVDNAVRTLTTTSNGPVASNVVSSLIGVSILLAIMAPLAVTRYANYAH